MGIAYWRGVISSGHVVDVLAHTLDLMPTFAALAGVDLRVYNRSFDGEDLSVLLRGQETRKKPVEYTKLENNERTGLGSSQMRRLDRNPLEDRVIFHQDAEAHLNAMRVGRYKLFFKTNGAKLGCRVNGSHHRWPGTPKMLTHAPPLVFDLKAD